ncbi:PilN domain-containing protein [Amphritea balenae]|uniref:Uncharacterized protein n=1 Tax=Amphritea balenae TaxID=452629 RepID=A0A3P1SHN5_9GAMM|nr:PilN domain-containing protein [Amphritea balenae]RRC96791.1 hypothetical protein EHS89_20355 [Amphritea balenae]GGK84883.1 fimbrial assembly family protein [Amphritea balenae]
MSGTELHSRSGSRLSKMLQTSNEFWLWWGGELAGLVPDAIRKYFKVQTRSVRVELINGSCRLHTYSGSRSALLTEFHLDQASGPEELEQRKALTSLSDQVVLLLPEHYILRKTISLPEATRSKLADVLNFEMDRNTPFKAEEVYFSYRISSHAKEQHKIQVELAIVTRAVLDELLEQLARQGVEPRRVVPQGVVPEEIDNPANDLLQRGEPGKSQNGQDSRQRKLWLLILLGLIVMGAFYQRYQHQANLQQAVIEPRAQAEHAKQLRDELQLLQDNRRFLIARKDPQSSSLVLLSELTRLLPDTTWISRLNLQDGTVVIQGESTNASALIAILEESTLFQDVRFSSPVTINPRSQKERFSISARQRQAGAQ